MAFRLLKSNFESFEAFADVLGCSEAFSRVQRDCETFQTVLRCPRTFWDVLWSSETYSCILCSLDRFLKNLSCSLTFWSVFLVF